MHLYQPPCITSENAGLDIKSKHPYRRHSKEEKKKQKREWKERRRQERKKRRKAKSQAVNSESVASANEKAEQNIVMESDLEISVEGETREARKRRKVDPAPTESVKSQLEQKSHET